MTAGKIGNDYLKDSLFDINLLENADYGDYDIDRHVTTVDGTNEKLKFN